MRPGIAGGPDLEIWSFVGIGQVIGISHPNWAMIARRRLRACESAFFAVQFSLIAQCLVCPLANGVRHKSDAINAVAVVESLRLKDTTIKLKSTAQFHVQKGVPIFRSRQFQFKHAPAFNHVFPFAYRRSF